MPYANLEERRQYQRRYYKRYPEKFKMRCIHNKRKTYCNQCGGGGLCEHKKRRNSCSVCSPGTRTKCPHGKFKWNCDDCGGLKRCEKHGRDARTCRICFPKSWAQRILSRHRQDARKGGYLAPKITPKELLELLNKSLNCCGCGTLLNYKTVGFDAPCLHHNHDTGEVVGFSHRECNSLEGQLQKLGNRLPTFIKNFFPHLVKETGEQ